MSEQRIAHHLQISEMQTSFVSMDGQSTLALAVHSLSVQITRPGLNQLVRHLALGVSVEVDIANSESDAGVELAVRARQWRFQARIQVQVQIEQDAPGSVLINLAVGSTWSLLDHTMLGLVRRKLRDVSRTWPEIVGIGSRSFRVDLQPMILQQLIEVGAPIQWNARLTRIAATSEAISVTFAQVPTPR